MNETKVYADGYFQSFAGEGDFLSFLKSRKDKTTWKKEASNNLRFEALVKDTARTEAIAHNYRVMGKEEIIEDTLDGTQLVLRAGRECIPVRSCAIKTILERARISGNALSKVDRSVFAKILNHCLKVADGQALLTSYINVQGDLILCEVFHDNGESGLNFQRPGFEAMIKGIRDGKYNCVVVKDLSRFGRNHLEAAYYIYKFFPQYNTRFIAINDDYDSLKGNKAIEDILLPIKNLINENYAREASRKVGISRRNTIDNGLFISAFAPFGYKKSETKVGRLEIDEEVAPIVRQVFDMFVTQDMSTVEISRQLNDEGVISPAQYKIKTGASKNKKWANAVWNTHTVKVMLSNPLYVGYLVLGKTRIDMYRNEPLRITKPEERNIVPDAHESIVSDEIYEMAQKKLEKNKHGPRSEKRNIPYIFNNLYCGCCGTKLSKQYRLDRKENVDLIFYSCPSDSRGKQTHCIFKKINEEELCEVVYESLHLYICMAVRNKKVYLNKKTKVLKEYEEDISRYTHIIENIEVMRTKLFDDFGADKINGREYNTLVSNYEEKQEHYSKLLENLKIEKEKYLDEIIDRQNWINRLLKYEKSDHLTREMVEIFIERINLFSATKIEIYYKFSDIFEDVMSNGGVYIG